MICKICQNKFKSLKALSAHIRVHNILKENYYIKYLKKENEGICYCGRHTTFISLTRGYHKYCSTKCQSNDPEILEKRKVAGDKHWTKRLGGPNKGKTYEEIHGKKKAKELKKQLRECFLRNCVGPGNPFYGKKHTRKNKELFRRNRLGKTYEQIYGFEKAKEIKEKKTKKNLKNCGWRDYWSEYPLRFYDNEYRKTILLDQDCKCAICFKNISERGSKNLHHINYIKNDNRRRNLIYLCVGCHSTTNGNRLTWKIYLRSLNNLIVCNKKLSRKLSLRIDKVQPLEFRETINNRRMYYYG